jgi:hypothetical protein
MRGLLLGVLVLVAMDVLLTAPASRVATVFNRPSRWLAAWMDPAQPLIPAGHLGQAAGGQPQPSPDKGGGGLLSLLPGLLP